FMPMTSGEAVGGMLAVDDPRTSGMVASLDPKSGLGTHPGAVRFTREFNDQLTKQGLPRDKREETFFYLCMNQEHMGKAIAQMYYLIGAREVKNAVWAKEIDDAMLSRQSYDQLPMDLKRRYNQIVVDGMNAARLKYAD